MNSFQEHPCIGGRQVDQSGAGRPEPRAVPAADAVPGRPGRVPGPGPKVGPRRRSGRPTVGGGVEGGDADQAGGGVPAHQTGRLGAPAAVLRCPVRVPQDGQQAGQGHLQGVQGEGVRGNRGKSGGQKH